MSDEIIAYGPWVAFRLREGDDPNRFDVARLSGPYLEWLGACRMLNGADRRSGFDAWAKHHPNGSQVIQAVLAVPANLTEYPELANGQGREVVYVDLPDLPKDARLTAAMERVAGDTGQFLADYVDHTSQIVNTIPAPMAESAALAIVSIAIARRLHFQTYFEPCIYPNLWVLWVAESTVFHKTTGLNVARRLIRATMPHLLLPEESSADRLIQELAGLDPMNYNLLTLFDQERWRKAKLHAGQRGLVIDEASSLFSGFRKDYNIGKIETFLKAYDCDDEKVHSTIKHGNVYLRHLYMPILGATTPAAIQQAANLQMWQMGFWPRFILLVPPGFPERLIHSDEFISRPAALDSAITRLLDFLPKPAAPEFGNALAPPPSLAVSRSIEVWRHWVKYNDTMSFTLQNHDLTPDDRMRLMYGRLPVRLLQVATLLAALDWNGKDVPPVRLCHYARAHQICEQWRINAHRFVEVMDRPLAGMDRERRLVKTISDLGESGRIATSREIQRSTGWPRDQVDALLLQMQSDNLIEIVESPQKRSKVWKVCQ
jgi:hypothetical protein